MAVYEVEAPPEVFTEREQRARTLEAAALEIEVRGWAKGPASAYWESGDSVCIVGGICAAESHHPLPGGNADYNFAEDVWGWRGGWATWQFNDLRAKSADEVTFLLRWRAEEIRDGWDA